MELVDESPDGWPFQLHVASNCTSPSIGGISAVSNSSGNPFCLFYSPTNNSVRNNVIQSSRASNSWIASLRSHSSLISTLDSRQHHYELSKRDCSGRINGSNGSGSIHGRSFSIDGRLPLSSHSLPSTSFRHWGSLESIHRNQRLRQLAAQSTTKVRSLSARESTAAAERWRYIQTVLERRRKQSLEHRERFIRRPLDDILRQKAISQSAVQPGAASWDCTASGRSILKRRTANWRMRANRHVHFDAIQPDDMEDCHDYDDARQRAKLPIIAIPEETESQENESPAANEMDQRLPPLAMPSPGIIAEGDGGATDDNTSQHLYPVGPSWVERQVAKVRQRKLWAFRQQQQKQQQQMDHPPPRAVLKRSVSLVVNVPDDESDRDSLDEEEDDQSQIELEEIARHQSLVWQVMLDKDELLDPADEQTRDEPSIDYAGWPNFPARLAGRIQKRQDRLRKRKANRKEKNIDCCNVAAKTDDSFIRRKRFGKRLSIALIRQRKAKINRAPFLANGQHPTDRLANDGQENKKTNAEETTHPALIVRNPIAEDSGLISLQIAECPDEIAGNLSSIHPDVVAIIAPGKGFNGTRAAHPSDAINEEDVVTQSVMESASVSQETIEADVYYRLEGVNPVADSLAGGAADKRRETAASAFRPSSACGRQEEITDESISDVTVEDGRHLIDQSNDTSDAIPAKASKKNEAGMARGPRDAIPPEMSAVDQIEYQIASAFQDCCDGTNKDGPVRRRRPAYCSAWPLLISNQKSDAIPPAVASTVSYWNYFQDPTSEKAIVHPAAASTRCHLTPEDDPGDTSAMMKNGLDKKTKDAHNVSRVWPPSRASVPTQTDPQSVHDLPEADKLSDPIDDVKDVGEAANECQCLHRAVLTCLLPEAAETLANLELIRRQLKRARIRRQENEHQRQPLQARRDVFSGIDPTT